MDEQDSVGERSGRISRLLDSQGSRTAYIKAKLGVLVPAQIRALRLKSINPPMPFQKDLARESEIKQQSRISMIETPGAANITLETLAKVAAGLKVGVVVKFVPFSDMLRWENSFCPNDDVIRLDRDYEFISPNPIPAENAAVGVRSSCAGGNVAALRVISDNAGAEGQGRPPVRELAISAAAAVGGR
jgi:hypothetical protein